MTTRPARQFPSFIKKRKIQNSSVLPKPVPPPPPPSGIVYCWPDTGDVYTGEWDETKTYMQGYGTMRWKNGTIHTGDWSDGLPHGKGIRTFVNGQSYEGDWFQGVYHGQGTLKTPKFTYVGSFRFGQMCGTGEYKTKRMIYRGEFKAGEMCGQGERTITGIQGTTVYKGTFADGMPHGIGIHHHYDGTIYKGCFVHGLRHGRGRLQYPVSNPVVPEEPLYYDGTFKDGRRHGWGIMSWCDGTQFRLQYNRGKELAQDPGCLCWLASNSTVWTLKQDPATKHILPDEKILETCTMLQWQSLVEVREVRQAKIMGHCVTCMEEKADVAFDDCGHVVMCHECVDHLQSHECPMCRKPFHRILRLYAN